MTKIDAKQAFSANGDDAFSGGETFYFKIFGFEKSEITENLSEYAFFKEVRITADTSFLDTLLTVEFTSELSKTDAVNTVVADIYNRFADAVYADRNVSLSELIIEMLKIRSRRISVAESLTGGLICSKIIEIPGASEILHEGLVVYSDQAKTDRLHISEKTIEERGAVSAEISHAMCRGLLDTGKTDYVLSTTGIAGPTGDTLTKPIGLCYISVGNKENILTNEYVFTGDRTAVREKAANTALFLLIKFAKSH